jgi:hypothetical protein
MGSNLTNKHVRILLANTQDGVSSVCAVVCVSSWRCLLLSHQQVYEVKRNIATLLSLECARLTCGAAGSCAT